MGLDELNQALILLEKCEKLDGYVAACQNSSPNSIARRNCQYSPWTDQSLAKKCKSMAPLSKRDVDVVILTPSAEGGMPHTRAPNVICLPAYWSDSLLEETLKHELIHISQRQNPMAWKKRMAAEGWAPVPEFELPPEWVSRCRINPDTYDARFWAWQGRHVPMPIFDREDRPELREISVRWWDGEEERLNNNAPDSFIEKYGNLGVSQIEHPYELYAYDKHN